MVTILLYDENTPSRRKLDHYLTERGYRVVVAKSYDSARLRIRKQVDLIVVNAPRISEGVLNRCERLKRLPECRERKIPLILLYEPTSEEERDLLFCSRGIDRVLRKPFKLAELAATIADLLLELSNSGARKTESDGIRKIPLAGTLRQVSFGELLTVCVYQKLTGSLTLSKKEDFKRIHFQEGRIITVRSSFNRQESLGTILVRQGKLTPRLNELSLKKAKKRGCTQGEILIELGWVSPHELYEGLVEQARTRIVTLFSWKEAGYEIEEGAQEIPTDFPVLDLDLMQIVRQGVETYSLDRLKRYFSKHCDKRLRILPKSRIPFDKNLLKRPEKILVSYIAAEHTLNELLSLSEIDLTQTLRLVLLLLTIGKAAFESEVYLDVVLERKRGKEEGLPPRPMSDRPEGKPPARAAPTPKGRSSEGEATGVPSHPEGKATAGGARGEGAAVQHALLDLLVQSGRLDARSADQLRRQIEKIAYHQIEKVLLETGVVSSDEFRRHAEAVSSKRKAHGAPPPSGRDFPVASQEASMEEEVAAPEEEILAALTSGGAVPPPEPDEEEEVTATGEELGAPEEVVLAAISAKPPTSPSLEESNLHIDKVLLVEISTQEGLEHLERGEYDRALEAFAHAIRFQPDDPLLTAHYAWAKFKGARLLDRKGREAARREGRRLLEETIERHPETAQAYLYLGMMTLGEGETERARRYLEMALRCDPDCAKAREILEHLAV